VGLSLPLQYSLFLVILTVLGTGFGRELYLQYQRRKVEALEDERIKFEISTIGHYEVRPSEPRTGLCIFDDLHKSAPPGIAR
jgi:hypothetical protein